jgi:hypothetical protein
MAKLLNSVWESSPMPKANPDRKPSPKLGSAPSKIDDDVALGSAAADQRIAVGRDL